MLVHLVRSVSLMPPQQLITCWLSMKRHLSDCLASYAIEPAMNDFVWFFLDALKSCVHVHSAIPKSDQNNMVKSRSRVKFNEFNFDYLVYSVICSVWQILHSSSKLRFTSLQLANKWWFCGSLVVCRSFCFTVQNAPQLLERFRDDVGE